MAVHLQASVHVHFQVEQTMPCKSVQHVVKKSDSGVDLRLSRSVQIQADLDLRLFRISN